MRSEIVRKNVVLLHTIFAGEKTVSDSVVSDTLGDHNTVIDSVAGSAVNSVTPKEGAMNGGIRNPELVGSGQGSEHVEVNGISSQDIRLSSTEDLNTTETTSGGSKRNHDVDSKSSQEGVLARIGRR